MSLTVHHPRWMRVCLCHRLSRSISLLSSLQPHGDMRTARLVKFSMPARDLRNLFQSQQRNYSTRRSAYYCSRSLKHSSEASQHADLPQRLMIPKVSCSTYSWTHEDDVGLIPRSHLPQETERCLSEVPTAQELRPLRLPPAESIEELRDKYRPLRKTKKYRFVLRPELAKLMVDKVWPEGDLHQERAFLIETSPGPGILTRHLLNSGAPSVLSMEREKAFLPSLGSLASKAEGRLRVMHADFFSMHYHGTKDIRPPTVRIAEVFDGVNPVPWEDDIAVKIVGSLPHRSERTHAYIIASQLLERLSSFKYGRVQFNLLMSEGCYDVISHPVGNMMKYRALSALMQMSCDIELLHKVPQVSFRLPTSSGNSSKSDFSDKNVNLCLVRLTPKRDLFIKHRLSQQQAFIFVYFVRQVLAKRRQYLSRMIESWAPGHSDIVQDFGYDHTTLTGNVEPNDLLRIYMAICQVDSFNGSWMGEDVVGYASRALELDSDQEFGYGSMANCGMQQ